MCLILVFRKKNLKNNTDIFLRARISKKKEKIENVSSSIIIFQTWCLESSGNIASIGNTVSAIELLEINVL